MAEQDKGLAALFKNHSTLNDAKSKQAGRPIYDDMEICEIRTPGDRNLIRVYPAHEVSHWDDTPEGGREPVTYAMRFPEQYKRFKNGTTQSQSGTPLEELPFLTQGKRLELKALNIHTAEALAGLDGTPLKQLGIGGRELKNQAQAYLDRASNTADVTKLAGENELLRQRLADLERDVRDAAMANAAKPVSTASNFEGLSDDELKAFIADKTGSKPRGVPSHATLVRMCEDLTATESEAA